MSEPQWTLHDSVINLNPAWEHRLAVCDKRGGVTYTELRRQALRVAAWLQSRGHGPGDRIALCLPKSTDTVLLILGILAAGAVYVPIDPNAPVGRLLKIVGSARPARLILHPAMQERLEVAREGSVLPPMTLSGPGRLEDLLAGVAPVRTPATIDPDDLATILFTSGSTGEPKGVTLTHRNVSAFVAWAVDTFRLIADDRMTSHAPFHFDLSTLDLFGTFRVGAQVHILDENIVKFPGAIAQLLERERITVWYSVPTALRLLHEKGGIENRDLSALRLIFFAGEVFPVSALRALMKTLPRPEYVNLYGPTETNVCTYYRLPGPPDEQALSIPIGRPCEHLQVALLDASGAPASGNEQGEICVFGPAVTPGYWGRRDLTAPTRVDGREDSYRTGDFGTWDEDGNIHFAGRRDAQVKIRGHRVELMEIESVLMKHPGVKEAAVAALAEGEMDPHLVAYVVFDQRSTSAVTSLHEHCALHLPAYCRPAQIEVMEDFPRTSTGKIDRQGLAVCAQSAH